MKFAIVRSCFNEDITAALLNGAKRAFDEAGVTEGDITVVEVPGSWEIPFAALQLAQTKKYAAIVTVGAIMKGETSHNDWIAHGVFPELQRIATDTGVPVTLGIVTCDTEEQAVARSGNNPENRGYAAAKAALEMASLTSKVRLSLG